MNKFLCAILVISSVTVFGQVKPTTSTPSVTPATSVVPTAPKVDTTAPKASTPAPVSAGPKGQVLTPASITYGDAKIPGDAEVLLKLGDMNELMQQYSDEKGKFLYDLDQKYNDEKGKFLYDLDQKYNPKWQSKQLELQQSIQRVKNANKWGDDVVFVSQTKQWLKLDKTEIEAMKKATTPSQK